jgi:ATP-dependent DNA helicase RecQ
VELVRRYAETSDCRRRLILQLLGETVLDPCGHCDNCDAGTATVTRPGRFALGTTVRHAHWGRGVVEQLEGEHIVVLFDQVGHRALSTDVVEDKGLLTPD